ncbi:RdgB/HAM1 family non-canonical purine NTP pyrophosphatase [Oleispirillum naphthae]|uniref:RdgB/HAM1 family non-canonical purine NTP pyrophosphatase n=1 Tax=Oleispirillum naphthae TaxID=2838853 RepID=UPI0030822B9E
MARQFSGSKLVIASHNAGKVKEIAELLEGRGIAVVSAGDLGLPEPEETGETFAENAALKARAAAEGAGLPALADDSGLCVTSLENAPGIHSARWAGPNRDFSYAMERIRIALGDSADREAHFVCALALAWPDGHCEILEGRVDGQLTFPPRGEKGFGYDPIFVPVGDSRTFAEMEPAEKHAMSHRARAFRKLLDACFGEK